MACLTQLKIRWDYEIQRTGCGWHAVIHASPAAPYASYEEALAAAKVAVLRAALRGFEVGLPVAPIEPVTR
jgi:hypothetical protein